MIREAIGSGDTEIILDIPPDFTMTSLIDRKSHKPKSKQTLPEYFNLLHDEISDIIFFYHDHPLERGFTITFWKLQDINFDKVILRSEQPKGRRRWTLDNLCIAFSKVRIANVIRYFTLSEKFTSNFSQFSSGSYDNNMENEH